MRRAERAAGAARSAPSARRTAHSACAHARPCDAPPLRRAPLLAVPPSLPCPLTLGRVVVAAGSRWPTLKNGSRVQAGAKLLAPSDPPNEGASARSIRKFSYAHAESSSSAPRAAAAAAAPAAALAASGRQRAGGGGAAVADAGSLAWSEREVGELLRVHRQGTPSDADFWEKVASQLPGRSARECSERYYEAFPSPAARGKRKRAAEPPAAAAVAHAARLESAGLVDNSPWREGAYAAGEDGEEADEGRDGLLREMTAAQRSEISAYARRVKAKKMLGQPGGAPVRGRGVSRVGSKAAAMAARVLGRAAPSPTPTTVDDDDDDGDGDGDGDDDGDEDGEEDHYFGDDDDDDDY